MIYSETIEIVYSSISITGVSSEEDPDYRRLEGRLRISEDEKIRITENEEIRTLEP